MPKFDFPESLNLEHTCGHPYRGFGIEYQRVHQKEIESRLCDPCQEQVVVAGRRLISQLTFDEMARVLGVMGIALTKKGSIYVVIIEEDDTRLPLADLNHVRLFIEQLLLSLQQELIDDAVSAME